MDCASFARSVRFPSVAFRSHQEFQHYWSANRTYLEAREAYHESLATRERSLTCKGTCAPCLRPVEFLSVTDDGAALKDGRRMPDWDRQMRCDCADGMAAHERVLIHFLQASVLAPWAQLLVFGPCSIVHRLTPLVGAVTRVARLQSSHAPVLDAPGERFHLVVAQDYLNFVPPLQSALTEIFRVLVAGGRFVFTVPFQCTAASSILMDAAAFSFAPGMPTEFRGIEHKFGWDLLPMLRSIGFSQATAYLYWSEELGYLGNTNFIFKAVK
jgi:methyltransferase family protein